MIYEARPANAAPEPPSNVIKWFAQHRIPHLFSIADIPVKYALSEEEVGKVLFTLQNMGDALVELGGGRWLRTQIDAAGRLILPNPVRLALYAGGLGTGPARGLARAGAGLNMRLGVDDVQDFAVAVVDPDPISVTFIEHLGMGVIIRDNHERKFLNDIEVMVLELAVEDAYLNSDHPEPLQTVWSWLERMEKAHVVHRDPVLAVARHEDEATYETVKRFFACLD